MPHARDAFGAILGAIISFLAVALVVSAVAAAVFLMPSSQPAGAGSGNPALAVLNRLTAATPAELAAVLDDFRPHLVVTYDPGGGYGHLDHIRAHEMVHAAVEESAPSGGYTDEIATSSWWATLPTPRGWQR